MDFIKNWLPMAIFFLFIFKDPYSYLIPIKQPELTYSEKTTWLLTEENKVSSFSNAYNQKFASTIYSENNAFKKFCKIIDLENLSAEGKVEISKHYRNDEGAKPILADLNFVKKNPLQSDAEQKNIFLDESLIGDQKSKIFKLIDSIDVTSESEFFEMPCFANSKDNDIIALCFRLYILALKSYAVDADTASKAISQLKLLSNLPDSSGSLLALVAYQKILKKRLLNMAEQNKLAYPEPSPESLKKISTQYRRAILTNGIIESVKEINGKLKEIIKFDQDLYVDQNAALAYLDNFYKSLDKILSEYINHESTDQIIDAIAELKESLTIDSFLSRPLAERLLFSLSTNEKYAKLSTYFAKSICEKELEYIRLTILFKIEIYKAILTEMN